MTRMLPMIVTRLSELATRMMSTISTVVYGLPERRLVLMSSLLLKPVEWEKFKLSMLSGLGYSFSQLLQARVKSWQYTWE